MKKHHSSLNLLSNCPKTISRFQQVRCARFQETNDGQLLNHGYYPPRTMGEMLYFSILPDNSFGQNFINEENISYNIYLNGILDSNGIELESCLNWTNDMDKIINLSLKSGFSHVTEVKIPSGSVKDEHDLDLEPDDALLEDTDFLEINQMSEEQLDDLLRADNIDPDQAVSKVASFIDEFNDPNVHSLRKYKHEKLVQETREKTVGEVLSEILSTFQKEKQACENSLNHIQRRSCSFIVGHEVGHISIKTKRHRSLVRRFMEQPIVASYCMLQSAGQPIGEIRPATLIRKGNKTIAIIDLDESIFDRFPFAGVQKTPAESH